jgi:hypothetical protein
LKAAKVRQPGLFNTAQEGQLALYEPQDAAIGYAIQSVAQIQKERSLTETVLERVQSMLSTADDINNRLVALRDRTFGAIPETGGARGPQPVPSSRAEEIMMAIEALQNRLYTANSLSSELHGRL